MPHPTQTSPYHRNFSPSPITPQQQQQHSSSSSCFLQILNVSLSCLLRLQNPNLASASRIQQTGTLFSGIAKKKALCFGF
ncbi:hypothetical protein MRB53_004466 [Persea americana]|uniref:Uncharacterized protein n=1 Tax=Persea americana TaxID=3435 RepID=A0ACC2MBA1_PERAE|nr:hypothetical protein MRB53_004466 [Persea americana]